MNSRNTALPAKFRPFPLCVWILAMLHIKTALAAQAAFSTTSAAASASGSLADIDHVVLFMQENRAFDHYFGTMAGVRGFADPNVQVNAGSRSVWQQEVNATLTNATDHLLPWHLNYLGGSWLNATQCMVAGDNGWNDNHAALNGDLNNKWALNNTPWSWGYFKRSDIPVHFAIAEGWTIGDMYQESVIASTNPNRVTWVSGSINAPGSPQTPAQGGMTIDNNENPGCEGPNLNCYPLSWTTAPEIYEKAGVSWQVYQDTDNFDDNPLAWFSQYQAASPNTSLGSRGMSFIGLDRFYADAAAGTLPQISYIIGPAELSEHPPYQPKDGAWLQERVVNAVINSPRYNSTALIVSYDETGGFGDHVVPYHSPKGTSGEWIEDPYGEFGDIYTGPGFRVPFYIISPWTRGGHVFTEHADHVSQLLFLDRWLAAKGHNVSAVLAQIPPWRVAHMSDLTGAFDFSAPDASLPRIPAAEAPSVDPETGLPDGYALCEATHASARPPVPYGNQTSAGALAFEEGFKGVRGALTEGRWLVFEAGGWALASDGVGLVAETASAAHKGKSQRWVVHSARGDGKGFAISNAESARYIGCRLSLVDGIGDAAVFDVEDMGNGKGYSVLDVAVEKYLGVAGDGVVQYEDQAVGFSLFSVTYRD